MERIFTAFMLIAGLTAPVLTATPADATSVIQFGRIYYNAPGADTSANTSVNGEYVQIRNLSTRNLSLTSWTVRDAQNHVYRFGAYVLPARKTLTLHTGKGRNSLLVRYWGLGYHVWNNTGDRAYLRNARGVLQDYCTWGRTGSYKNC